MNLTELNDKVKKLGLNRVAAESGLSSKPVVYRVLRGLNTETKTVEMLAAAARTKVHVSFQNAYSREELESLLSQTGMPVFGGKLGEYSGGLSAEEALTDKTGLLTSLVKESRYNATLSSVVPYFLAEKVTPFHVMRAFEYLSDEEKRVLGYYVSLASEFSGFPSFQSLEELLFEECFPASRESVTYSPLLLNDSSLSMKYPRKFAESDRLLSKWKLVSTTATDDHLRRFEKWKTMKYE